MSEDQVFREVVSLIYGDGASELIRKANPDGMDLHGAAASASATKKKREKTQARVGLASNIVGLGAGVGGTAAALRDPRLKGRKSTKKIYRLGEKIPTPISSKAGKTGAVLAGGALGLQVANIAGDTVANRVLARSAKTEKPRKKISKGVLISKDISELPEASSLPTSRRGMTLAAVTSSAKAGGKGLEYTKEGAKRLPEKVQTTKGKLKALKAKGDVEKSAGPSSAGEVEVTWEGEIAKADMDKQQIFGWASVIEMNGEPIIDLQGDRISTDEMEKSAYEYVMKSRKGGDMHLRDNWEPIHKSDMIESFMVTPEKRDAMGLPDSVPTGWWVGFKVNDPEVWSKVKSGERTGFSIHGRGRRS